MRLFPALITVCLLLAFGAGLAVGEPTYSWRYYRPGNTGIQGDTNETIWIDADGDPWIGGYSPIAEEGGIAKFVQAENRWVNVSNIDYPVIGSANDVGYCRATDMVADGLGNLWIGTWRGALRMNLAAGPSSLVRFGPGNSALPGGVTNDITRAPDGTIWISASSSVFGGGGLTRYNPAANQWSHINGHGGLKISAQAKPAGGYYLWASGEGFAPMERWDSTTQTWTSFPATAGNPSHLVSKDSIDDVGNLWIQRWIGEQGEETLDCLRPDGTWLTPPLPPQHPQVGVAALRAFGNLQALMVNGYGHLYRFDGTAWTDLGLVPHNGYYDDLDIAADGTIWLCGMGTGGALRRDAETGAWQRYRITNTSQFDLFNNDLAIDPVTGDVYATANASPGIGGMVKFDGTRWTGFVTDLGYGLTGPWPFQADQSEAIDVRANGHVVVNPYSAFTHEFDGIAWAPLPGGWDQMHRYAEDSLGRLWGTGHYGGLGYFESGGFTTLGGGDWWSPIQRDPDRPGTIWTNQGWSILRTDGSYAFSRALEDFPELGLNHFSGLAVAADGAAWVGAATSTGSALLRLDANSGDYQAWQTGVNWPFPGDFVYPQAVTPDGRVWMTYDSNYPSTVAGLLWWDGVDSGIFPAPPNGEWQWGGLPHAGILDLNVKPIPDGYELWLSCMTRGIAVLTVQPLGPTSAPAGPASLRLALEPSAPNPFRASTTLGFSLPGADRVQVGVYDVQGRRIRHLLDDRLPAGRSAVSWDGKDDEGRSVVSGVYFWQLKSTSGEATQRMLLMR